MTASGLAAGATGIPAAAGPPTGWPPGYLVPRSAGCPPAEPAPPTFADCRVTPLVDGVEYTAALCDALARVGNGATREANAGQVVLVAGWWLGLAPGAFRMVPGALGGRFGSFDVEFGPGAPFCLDPWPDPASRPFDEPPDEATALLDVLLAKARAGVDVRVLGWVSAAARHHRLARLLGAAHLLAINTLTVRSVQLLRAEPAIGARAVLNTVGHTVGGCHSKVVLVCDGEDAVGFTGGMDLELGRWARHDHRDGQVWHDVVARVEGPAVQSIHDHFRSMWNENLRRPVRVFRIDGVTVPNRLPAAPPLPGRALPVTVDGSRRHAVQALQTCPAARFARARLGPRSRPLRTAPEGLFSYRAALRTAIAAARRYVYVEDQLYWSGEVMQWLNRAVRLRPDLRVLLLLSGLDDPNDPPLPHSAYLVRAVNDHLLAGLDGRQRGRIGLFRRDGVVVHAKTVVVDDVWASIGSCNIARRSLYTDIEHGVSFVDTGGGDVRAYRARLWAHHFRHPEPADFGDLASALHAWLPGWGRAGRAPARPPWLVPLDLPLPEAPLSRRERWLYESFHDCDSRTPWSGYRRRTRC